MKHYHRPLLLTDFTEGMNKQDDICKVVWNPKVNNMVVSGSIKGDIRVFDVTDH